MSSVESTGKKKGRKLTPTPSSAEKHPQIFIISSYSIYPKLISLTKLKLYFHSFINFSHLTDHDVFTMLSVYYIFHEYDCNGIVVWMY